MNRTAELAATALSLIAALLVAVAIYWHGQYKTLMEDNQQLQRDNDQQTAVIATQAFQFNRFNQITASQQQYAVAISGQQQEREIEYRTILKTEPTCDLAVPVGIAGRLLNYTNRLRASAMHADTGITDSASVSSITSSTLTYCQAVLWIDPLLTAIDKANSQLSGIRLIEQQRTSK